MALWVVAFAGEVTADAQLAAFKKRPESKGHTCQSGLWHYSRHPNYFFESVIWPSFALFAHCNSQYGWIGFLSPALILYFLLRVTGIPATEEQAVRSREAKSTGNTSALQTHLSHGSGKKLTIQLAPDWLIRIGIRRLLRQRLREEESRDAQKLIAELRTSPIAINTRDANRQHYEVPAAFYGLVLGEAPEVQLLLLAGRNGPVWNPPKSRCWILRQSARGDSRMGSRFWNWGAGGDRCRSTWRSGFRGRGRSPAYRTPIRSGST